MRLIILILTIGVVWSVGSIVEMNKVIVNLKPLEGYKYEPSYWATSSAGVIEPKLIYIPTYVSSTTPYWTTTPNN